MFFLNEWITLYLSEEYLNFKNILFGNILPSEKPNSLTVVQISTRSVASHYNASGWKWIKKVFVTAVEKQIKHKTWEKKNEKELLKSTHAIDFQIFMIYNQRYLKEIKLVVD